MEDCIFCEIVKGEIPSFKVYEDDRVLAFGDVNPISKGHTLVIPKRHAQDLWEISMDDLSAVHMASKRIIHAIKAALKPTGVACLQLNGKGANQVVPHYHLHVIPRLEKEPELPVSNWELKPGNMEAIKEVMEMIASGLK